MRRADRRFSRSCPTLSLRKSSGFGRAGLRWGSRGCSPAILGLARPPWHSTSRADYRRTPWPDGSGTPEVASTLFFTAEDGIADTIRPRVDAHHGDPSKIVVVSGVCNIDDEGERRESEFTLRDLPILRDAIEAHPT